MQKFVLLDNTALTNFALVGRPDLILDLWPNRCATTSAVVAEYQAGIVSRGLPKSSWENLVELSLTPDEQDFSNELSPQLGRGERTCIAVAAYRNGLLVCDDAKARQVAQRHDVKVSGTIGVLVLNIRQDILTLATGNAILASMIAHGYRSPVPTLDELI